MPLATFLSSTEARPLLAARSGSFQNFQNARLCANRQDGFLRSLANRSRILRPSRGLPRGPVRERVPFYGVAKVTVGAVSPWPCASGSLFSG